MRRTACCLVVLAVVGVAFAGCGGRAEKEAVPKPAAAPPRIAGAKDVRFVEEAAEEGLKMTLREVDAPAERPPANAIAAGKVLAAPQTAKLLARVEAMEIAGDDVRDLALRPGPVPPPQTGRTVDLEFPPEEPTPAPPPDLGKPGTLEVMRYAPEGEVPLAPHLSVTFSRPMVAVTGQAEAAATVPAALEPVPAGAWRWLGTRTLLFQPEVRFPMATDYTVRIPAGTRSVTDDKLAKAVSFSFSTPPPAVTAKYPEGGPRHLEPIVFVGFDQRVDPAAVLRFIEVRNTGEAIPIRLAAAEEIAADDEARRLVEAAEEGRFVALRAASPLPKGATFDVVVKKGAPSAEGPKTTPGDQQFQFFTFHPLAITQSHCSWNEACPPTAEWRIEFNNPLDDDAFDPAAITVTPEVPGLHVVQYGNAITISGLKQGRTRYVVTVPASLEDGFGQTLGRDEQVTFDVGPAEQTLFGPPRDLVTLDPAGPPELSVHSVNHDRLRVVVHKVAPEQWTEWTEWQRKYRYETTRPGALPGKKVLDAAVKVKGEKDRLVETKIDLRPYLDKGHGQLLVHVEPARQPKEEWRRQEILAWVQVTDLGIAAFVDNREMLAWTTRLKDGTAMRGVRLELLPGKKIRAESDGAGLARLALGQAEEEARLLVARTADDAAILPAVESGWWGGGWRAVDQADSMRWYAFDDRGIYRPGEEVRVKGWIRRFEPGPGGDIRALATRPSGIRWKLRGPRGHDIAEGTAELSALAGFDIELALPKEVDLGTAWLELAAERAGAIEGTVHTHAIQIQEFRRPEFEVSASAEPGPHLLGTEAVVNAAASYYAGGGLPNAPVTWTAYAAPSDYTPPNRDDYEFGVWSPWWRSFDGGGGGASSASLEGKTDALGRHHLGIRFESVRPTRPMSVRVEATVTDVNRQAWTASEELLVHPADLYVGLKTDKTFVEKGDPVEVDAIAVDIDGRAVPGVAVALEMARMETTYKKGKWEDVEKDIETCDVASAAEAARCTFRPKIGGSYRIEAILRDGFGRPNRTELRVWVSGGELPPARSVEQEALTLVPAKREYRPGEVASFLIQAPFFPAEGVLTVRRSGLVREERFRMDGPTHTVEVPILESFIPDVTVQVDLVGAAVRGDDTGEPRKDLPRRVAFARGSLTFQVPPLARTLDVAAVPRETALEPGGKTSLALTVKDAAGKPVPGAELVVVAADESVLALTGYRLPDPIEAFYAARGDGVADYHSRRQVVLSDPGALATQAAGAASRNGGVMRRMMPMAAPSPSGGAVDEGAPLMRGASKMKMAEESPMAAAPAEMAAGDDAEMDKSGGEPGGGGAKIAMRERFDALALFAPEVVTDARGRAEVPLTLPDSLTRYRVMVVAVEGGQRFGKGEANVTARLPLMVRPSPPRFLNFGDKFELPVVLQNQTNAPLDVDVAVRAANVSLADTLAAATPASGAQGPVSAGRRVRVPANDRVEVRFPAAAEMAGTARFQVVAASGGFADAARFDLPVWTPATTEAFATYGEIDQGAVVQPVRAPGDVYAEFGGLEITTSSTQLQALTDAVLYLVSYPFDCNEQISSRILAIAALRDVLRAFAAEGLPPPADLEASVSRDMARLAARQNDDGGFAMWRRGDPDWPYLTIHVAHALARAAAKGFEVPPRMWERVKPYLAGIERHIPAWYSKESEWAVRAYALSVRALMDDADAGKAKALLAEAGVDKLPMEAAGWILPVLRAGGAEEEVKKILRRAGNSVAETAAGAHFVTGYSDGAHVLLHSDRRADGILLESLIQVDGKSDLIPKIVRGLLGHRTRGKWSNTQENAFVLLALDRYFNTYEKVTPDFVARAWLGKDFAFEHAFKGRTTEQANLDIPMRLVAKRAGGDRLTLQKDGAGRLYYRIGMRYAPRDLFLAAADYGFAVERVYEAVDDPADVKRDADGTWRVKAGARVRVKLTMAVPARRYHVALVDPLPAGLEAVNPELAVTGTLPPDPAESQSGAGRYWWWWRPWYEHQNMRDERAEAFTSLLWDGVHSYTYVARATTPGVFVVPPAKAEEMYHPETFGRSGSDRVVVE